MCSSTCCSKALRTGAGVLSAHSSRCGRYAHGSWLLPTARSLQWQCLLASGGALAFRHAQSHCDVRCVLMLVSCDKLCALWFSVGGRRIASVTVIYTTNIKQSTCYLQQTATAQDLPGAARTPNKEHLEAQPSASGGRSYTVH